MNATYAHCPWSSNPPRPLAPCRRLPIVQGPSWTYLAPITAVMHLPYWKCPDAELLAAMAPEERTRLWQPRMNELLGALAVASVIQLLLGATGDVMLAICCAVR